MDATPKTRAIIVPSIATATISVRKPIMSSFRACGDQGLLRFHRKLVDVDQGLRASGALCVAARARASAARYGSGLRRFMMRRRQSWARAGLYRTPAIHRDDGFDV